MNTAALIGRLADDPVVTTSKKKTEQLQQNMFWLSVEEARTQKRRLILFAVLVLLKQWILQRSIFSKGTRVGVIDHIQGAHYENEEGFIVYTSENIVESQQLQTVLLKLEHWQLLF